MTDNNLQAETRVIQPIHAKPSGHLYAYDVLRVLCAIFVIYNHTIGHVYDAIHVNSIGWVLSAVLFIICKTAVPIFMMITGSLLINENRSFRSFFRYMWRMLALLFCWSSIHYCVLHINDPGAFSPTKILALLKAIVCGKPVSIHFWYMYAMAGIYLMLPFITKMVTHLTDKELRLFLALWVMFFCVIPFANKILPVKIAFESHFQYPLFNSWIGYVVLGYYLKWRRKSKVSYRLLAALSAVSVGACLAIVIISRETRIIDNGRYFPMLILSVCIFMAFINSEGFFRERRHRELIRSVAGTTFGIYLMHVTVKHVLLHFSDVIPFFADYKGSFAGVLGYDVVLFVVCCVITLVMKRVPGVRRLVM